MDYFQPDFFLPVALLFSCFMMSLINRNGNKGNFSGAEGEVKIMTLDPGHFHAALVQKNRVPQVDPTVHIFAPEGSDLELHIERIRSFNSREESPTGWKTEIHTGSDFLQRMLEEQPGNVMVTAGNNRKKTEYIKRCANAGINVLSDKPMAINKQGWELLVSAFKEAEQNGVFIYDIMTERNEVTSIIQKRLAQNSKLFGTLQQGSAEKPAIVKKSIHHLFKEVAGSPLKRPAWYFDVEQQGEGIVDVTTHLVDLTMWSAFPDQAVDYRRDIEMLKAGRWPTEVSPQQFDAITGMKQFPDYLQNQLVDGMLPYYSNGDLSFKIHGHHIYLSIHWDFEAPAGGGDSHYSVVRGTHADLVIRQGKEQNFKSTLFIEPIGKIKYQQMEDALREAVDELQADYPGLTCNVHDDGWQLDIPDKYYLGHEAHFVKVARDYFRYLAEGRLPDWEVQNMITKYYITTEAREMALGR